MSIIQGIWPGNKSTFTAPVFRRHTKQEDGWVGGGRWKYSVNASELHPITQTLNASSDNDDDKDLPGSEATVTSKDVAAGLIRMGLLTRIQHILEVMCFAFHHTHAYICILLCILLITEPIGELLGRNTWCRFSSFEEEGSCRMCFSCVKVNLYLNMLFVFGNWD